ncbi:diguanylate cyclase (GGDEF) domain-containing protein [Granulicatella balaenopterae]|uniref:Diguanylate cyclase (GGDEF) domain-containing protein n=1 Tax=Granulicatella balaenopterae TaxID=137733 RepID=A0A1H9KF66_9LACT|nr:GGDEF domain-containing protein [Granulicatella balaenopterae]SEQ97761.1 diguanylate cyclase (GGDEF) domain-containing protein [Granulicatella balaenopterae]
MYDWRIYIILFLVLEFIMLCFSNRLLNKAVVLPEFTDHLNILETFIVSAAVYILLDIGWLALTYVDFFDSWILMQVLLAALFICIVVMPYFWLSFVSELLDVRPFSSHWFKFFCKVLLFIMIILILTNWDTGLIFTLNENLGYTLKDMGNHLVMGMSAFFWLITLIEGGFKLVRSTTVIGKRLASMVIIFVMPILIALLAFYQNHISIYFPIALNFSLIMYLLTFVNLTYDIDILTKLYNRRSLIQLEKKIEKHLSRGGSLGIYCLDIDKFKLLNDQYGHKEGDRALAIVGQALLQLTHKRKLFAIRMGGDEFILLVFEQWGESFANNFALEIQQSIDNEVNKEELPYRIEVSVGSVMIHKPMEEPMLYYLEEADKRMYQVKQAKNVER